MIRFLRFAHWPITALMYYVVARYVMYWLIISKMPRDIVVGLMRDDVVTRYTVYGIARWYLGVRQRRLATK